MNQKRFFSLVLSSAMVLGCVTVKAEYPTTLLTPPTKNASIDNILGNIENDNSAWEFKYDIKYQNGSGKDNASFVLLDKNEAGEYLIATEYHIKDTDPFDTDVSNGWQYDPADTTNIAYRVNTYTTPTGGGRDLYYLGKAIYDHMVEKEWKIEAAPKYDMPERTITAKAVLPSYTEYRTYRDKLNSSKAGRTDGWYNIWLRTPSNYEADDATKYNKIYRVSTAAKSYNSSAKGELSTTTYNSTTTCRQLFFWVNSDFFKDIKFETIGSEVAAQIKADLTLEELQALYSATELAEYFGIESNPENAPVISNMKVSANIWAPGGTATVTYNSEPESDENAIAWYICDDAEGTNPVAIEGADSATLKIPSSAGGKYVMAGITPALGYDVGYEVYSEAFLVEEALEKYGSTIKVSDKWGMSESNNSDYVFSTSYTNFIMLEAAEDGSDFLVIADTLDRWATRRCLSGSGETSMDPEENEYIPAFLNSTYLEIPSDKTQDAYSAFDWQTSTVYGLPSNMPAYVNRDALWRTEASVAGDEYVFKAAVTLPSVSEIYKHRDKIGYIENISWATRTATNKTSYTGNLPMFAMVGSEAKLNGDWHIASNLYIRPIFRLNREYFIDNKVNLTEADVEYNAKIMPMGDKVKEMLVANFARSELRQAGYSEEELDLIGFLNNEPEVSNVNAQGISSVAQTLTANFEYSDPNESEMKKAEYQWYYADSQDGELNAIEGATGATYKITPDMLGKYIVVKVRVTNSEDVKSAWVKSGMVGAIEDREDIIVTPVSISNTKAEFVIDNAVADKDMVILYCVYNKTDNSLVDVAVKDIKAVNGEDTYFVDAPSTVTENHKVKAMVWDNLDSIRPYAMIQK